MAQITIVIGGGTPSHTVNIGTDEEALAMMRDALQGGPLQFTGSPLDDEPATLINWDTASDADVVKAYAKQLVKSGDRMARRGRRNRP